MTTDSRVPWEGIWEPSSGDANALTKRGVRLTTVGSASAFALQFLTTLFLARIFTPEEFGILSAVLILVSFADIFWQAGVGPSVVQSSSLTQRDVSTAITASLILGVTVACLMLVSSPALGSLLTLDARVLMVVSLTFVLNSVGAVPTALLQRRLKFGVLVIKDLVETVTYAAVAVILGLLDFGIWGLVGAILARCISGVVVAWTASPPKTRLGFSRASARRIVNFGGGVTLSRVLNTMARNADYLVIILTMDTRSLGLYSRVYQLVTIPANLTGKIIDQVFFPAMSRMQNANERIGRIHVVTTGFLAMLYFPIGVIVYFFSSEIVVILLGEQWIEAGPVLQVFCLFMFFRVAYKLGEPVAKAKGAVYLNALMQFVYALSVLFLAWMGSNHGLFGVAVGVGLALIINYVMVTLYVHRAVDFDIREYLTAVGWPLLVQTLAFLVAFAALTWGVQTNHAGIKVLTVGVVEAISMALMWYLCGSRMRHAILTAAGWRKNVRG